MLQNKTALITGGSKGIGYAMAQSLLAEGMNVCITGRSQESLDKAIASLSPKEHVLGVQADVRSYEDCEQAVSKTLNAFGKLDVLIANAGIGHFVGIDEMSKQQWDETIDINLTGVFNTVRPAVQALKESKGYLFTVASLAGTNFFARGAAYNASKFGLVGMTQAMMLDLRQYDIKVSTLMPGSVSTYFNNRVPSEADHWKIQPEDLGQMLVDLLKINPRTLPSKVEIRPSKPPLK